MNQSVTIKCLASIILLLINLAAFSQETDFTNGIDDDNDGFIDCGDTQSYGDPACAYAFECSNTLFQVISKSLKKLDPLTGTYELIGDASSSFNGAGYNVQDGFIYGIKSSSAGKHLWKINNEGVESDMGKIANFKGRTYVGDFDENGNLFTYTSGNNPSLSYVDIDASSLESITVNLTNLHTSSIPGVADITYNPKFKKFYGMSGGLDVMEIDHVNMTADVIADFTGQVDLSGGFGAAYSDIEGNSYFSNNATGKIVKVTFDESGIPNSITHVATGEPTNSNDGMGCFLSLPPFETSCTDGIDNDGDGLVDCADPDCSVDASCPFIEAHITGNEFTGPNGITPVHITLINNSSSDTEAFDFMLDLPVGFTYVSDSIEIIGNTTYSDLVRPIEGDANQLTWSSINIPVGDTVVISVGVLVDSNIQEDSYDFLGTSNGVIMNPYNLVHTVQVLEQLFYDPESQSCEPAFYQVYKKKGEPNIYGKLDVEDGNYDQIAVTDAQLNGLGFDQVSEFAYGSSGKKFVRLDQQGNETYLNLDFAENVYVGDADDTGYWYGKVGGDIVKVNIETATIESTYTGQGLPGWDMSFNIDGNFYATHTNQLYRFNTTTNQKETVGTLEASHLPMSGHGAQWTGKDGYHYYSNNASGKIFRVNVSTRETALVMQSVPGLQFNDGFSCPTEIPPVFEYDYGDYDLFPVASQWVYAQDVSDDATPDYAMVWIGDKILSETFSQANGTASIESDDDVLSVEGMFAPGESLNISFDLNTNISEVEANWGMWIDWNTDGTPDQYLGGVETISTKTTFTKTVTVPSNVASDYVGIRIRASEADITESNFSGEITEPGEVEDHVLSVTFSEICDNGIDDDNDGLTDCDDPDCSDFCEFDESSSSQEGGLESNRRLSQKIAETKFAQSKNDKRKDYLQKGNLSRFERSLEPANRNNYTLEDFIPLDAIPNTESYVNSPDHLIQLTNAEELFSIDIFEQETRVAAVLALKTINNVYEHSKYICDRLTGAEIKDVFTYPIDNGSDLIIAKISRPNGDTEYASSLSIYEKNNGTFTIESYWNLESYTNNETFFNFQIWASNTSSLLDLANEIVALAEGIMPVDEVLFGDAPQFYIQSGELQEDELVLTIINKAGINYVEAVGNYTFSETTGTEAMITTIPLSGEVNEEVSVEVGTLYDLGMTFYHPGLEDEDVIFLADGTWGAQEGTGADNISSYEIIPNSYDNAGNFEIKRDLRLSGSVQNYINIYRSFNPKFSAEDLQDYNSLHFTAKGSIELEIAVMKESIDAWEEQAKYTIQLTDDMRDYSLGKDFFASIGNDDWNDIYLLVFNVIGDGAKNVAFDLELANVHFGNKSESSSFVIYTDQNMLQSENGQHSSNIVDGTQMGEMEVTSANRDEFLHLYLKNTGESPIILDDYNVIQVSSDFEVLNFEPTELATDEIKTIVVRYKPSTYPSISNATIELFVQDQLEYIQQSINLNASSVCAHTDEVRVLQDDTIQEYKARSTLATDVVISGGKSITFSAQENIILEGGFTIDSGSDLIILNENNCNQ